MTAWIPWLSTVVAVVGSLAGVWLGSRLTARTSERHWRRDRIVEAAETFVADLRILVDTWLDPGTPVVSVINAATLGTTPPPSEATDRPYRASVLVEVDVARLQLVAPTELAVSAAELVFKVRTTLLDIEALLRQEQDRDSAVDEAVRKMEGIRNDISAWVGLVRRWLDANS